MLTRQEAVNAQFMRCKEFVGNSEEALLMLVNSIAYDPHSVEEYREEAKKVKLDFS